MPTKRNYRKEYDNYQGKPKQKKRRAARNTSRRSLGLYGKGGGDVDHSDGNPMNRKKSNLKVKPKSVNRSFKRTKTAGKKNARS